MTKFEALSKAVEALSDLQEDSPHALQHLPQLMSVMSEMADAGVPVPQAMVQLANKLKAREEEMEGESHDDPVESQFDNLPV